MPTIPAGLGMGWRESRPKLTFGRGYRELPISSIRETSRYYSLCPLSNFMPKKQPNINDILAAARQSDSSGDKTRQKPQERQDGVWNVVADHRCEDYTLEVAEPSEAALREALTELWRKLAKVVPQKYAEGDWSVIYVELWYDSGRVIVYPNRQPPDNARYAHQRDARVSFTVCSVFIEEQFNQCIDEEEQSAILNSAAALRQRILACIADEIRDSLEAVRSRQHFTIYWFEFNGEDGIQELC